ncbi:MAG: Na+/Ca+ antiporter, CaCA family [Candidatus Kaiserbacteria bacterium GW2011_GWC2_49_12]|uniref:Na+/Ca+ antiporter, CaCA family n=1 Tax=Candidatus Kaiserbacteria bacterium GW2011_GWC2_49_12 TaxID=1618675 RepID=A0A0G1VHU8_9BACT|nr:MAG: Na+/Ca+ antiporter, CaCA family [Candidatus Kaiserbacteria bacterium GW2011_GWC2_49_12]
MLLFWTLIFAVSLAVLVKGSNWLVTSAEKIGLAVGLSPFIVGVTIVGVGTSFPELISSFVAVLKGVPEVAAANAVGSNIANILLIVGLSALVGRKLIVTKSLIDLDLPLLAIGTVLLLGVLWDGVITFGEALLMMITYGVYLLYTMLHKESEDTQEIIDAAHLHASGRERQPTQENSTHVIPGLTGDVEREKCESGVFTFPSRGARNRQTPCAQAQGVCRFTAWDFFMLVVSIVVLTFGAKYLIDSLVQLSIILNLAVGTIAITAVAVGTSLPELFVSLRATFQKKSEIALGNIFGSNIFNSFVVIGLPGLFYSLPVDSQTLFVGVPTMAGATLLFVISGISRRIHMWEGAFYLSLYVLFLAKLFSWF